MQCSFVYNNADHSCTSMAPPRVGVSKKLVILSFCLNGFVVRYFFCECEFEESPRVLVDVDIPVRLLCFAVDDRLFGSHKD